MHIAQTKMKYTKQALPGPAFIIIAKSFHLFERIVGHKHIKSVDISFARAELILVTLKSEWERYNHNITNIKN